MTALSFHSRADDLLRRVLALTDEQLDGDFWWKRGEQQDDFTRRHGLYMLSELILAEADRLTPMESEGTALAAHVVEAAWDLRAVLLSLGAAEVEREPKAGEWSIAQAMDHMLGSQEFWNILFDLWLEQARRGEKLAFRHGGEEIKARRAGGVGLITDPRALIDELTELVERGGHNVVEVEALGLLHDPEVGFNRGPNPVPLAYYPRRWAAHLREHTVQVDKSLVWLGLEPAEQQRIARVTAGALGELEGAWWRAGRPSGLEQALAPAEAHFDAVFG
jgi:DinB family protein